MGLDNPIHLAFLLLILLLVFGAKRLPEMGRSLGSGLRGFKESVSGETPDLLSAQTAASTSEPAETVTEKVAEKVAENTDKPTIHSVA
jgi:sec-independent protein translocase protein TatA